jgi:hypothetical protein
MQRQLSHLTGLADRGSAELWIVPFDAGAYAGLNGPLILLGLADSGEDVSYAESVAGDQLIRASAAPA